MSQCALSDETTYIQLSDGYAGELVSSQMGRIRAALSQSLLLFYPQMLMCNRNRALLGSGPEVSLCGKSTYYHHSPDFIYILSYRLK